MIIIRDKSMLICLKGKYIMLDQENASLTHEEEEIKDEVITEENKDSFG